MYKMKKTMRIMAILMVVVSLLSLTACSRTGSGDSPDTDTPHDVVQKEESVQSSEETTETVQIVFWTTNSSEYAAEIEQFEKENPGIDVVTAYQGGYDDMYQKLQAAAMTGETPNVAQMGERFSIATLANAGLLANMDEILSDDAMNDILPAFLEHFTYKGHVVALPFCCSVPIMYYNKTLFEQMGLQVPTTWEELVEVATTLTIDENGDGVNEVWGVSFDDAPASYMKSYIIDHGGSLVDADGNINVNTKETVAMLQWVQDMVFEDKCMAANQYLSSYEDFFAGKVAILFAASACYNWFDGTIGEQFEFATAEMPSGPDGSSQVMLGGNALGVFKSTPEQEAASAKLVEFLISTENTSRNSMNSGYVPVRQSAIDSDDYQAFVVENPAWQVALNEMPNICTISISPSDTVLWNGLIDAMEKVSDNKDNTPAECAEELQKIVDDFIANYNH